MDQYFPLKFPRRGTRSVWLKNHTFYAGNPADYPIVFGMWTVYIFLSVVFLTIVNGHVFDYSIYLGMISYILGLPGIYFAVKCFLTEPGILPRGDILEPPADEEIVEEENQIRNHNADKVIDIEKQIQIVQEIGQSEDRLPQQDEQQQSQQQQQQQLELQNIDHENEPTNNKEPQTIQIQPIQSSPIVQVLPERTTAPSDDTPSQQPAITSPPPQPKLLQSRYCSTCCIMRPPMSSHCSSCNNCVKRFDHHCVFMGNCIGERNQQFFVLFLLSTGFWGIYVCICTFLSGIHYSNQSSEPYYVLTEQPLIITSLLITGSLSFLVCILQCHSNLKNYSVLAFLLAVTGSVIFSGVKAETIKLQDNPVVLLYLSAVYLFVVVFVIPQACFNTMIAAKGSTLKFEKYQAAVGQGRFEQESSATWDNFVNVICSKTVPSLVIGAQT